MNSINLLEGLRWFIAVAEAGGFSAAARLKGVQQSTVSRAITRLEEEYGELLFVRTTRSLALTEAGRATLIEARRILSDVDRLTTKMRRTHEAAEGLLRLSMPVTLGSRMILDWMGEFKRRHPMITLELHLEDREVNVMAEGYDLAVRVGPSADSSVLSRKLGVIHRGLYASRSLLKQLGPIRSPNDLEKFPGVRFADRTAPHPKWNLSQGKLRRSIPISVVTTVNHLDSVESLVGQGLGVGSLPRYFEKDNRPRKTKDRTLVRVLPEWELTEELDHASAVYLLFPNGMRTHAKVRTFADFLIKKFGSAPFSP